MKKLWAENKYCECHKIPEGCSHCRRCDGWNSRGKADRQAVEEALSVEDIYKWLAHKYFPKMIAKGKGLDTEELATAIRKQVMERLFGGEK